MSRLEAEEKSCTPIREDHVEMEAETVLPQPMRLGKPREAEGARNVLSPKALLPGFGFWTLGLLNCERTYFCCFKRPASTNLLNKP